MCSCAVGLDFDLVCDSFSDGVTCYVKNLNITERGDTMNPSSIDDDNQFEALMIEDQIVNFMPSFTDLLAQRLERLCVDSCHLKVITKEDLQQFPNLKDVSVASNDLEWLDGDLFEFNPRLEIVSFYKNKLTFIAANLLDSLINIKEADFYANYCIDSHEDLSQLKEIFQNRCKDESTKLKMLAHRKKSTSESTSSRLAPVLSQVCFLSIILTSQAFKVCLVGC